MNQTQENLLPSAQEPKLLDRPEAERLREELDHQPAGSKKPAGPKDDPPHEHHIAPWKVVLGLVIAALLVAAVALFGYLPRKHREQAASNAAKEEASTVPGVSVTRVKTAPRDTEVLLPGSLSPLTESSIYARASGYVRKRYVDIGDHVREGQLMADIETPDLDQQVAQGRAAVAQAQQQLSQTKSAVVQAEAQRDLAKVTNDRYQNLVKRGAIAQQDADTQAANLRTSQAIVEAQQANVGAADENVRAAQASLERIISLQEFQKVRAPFTGVVTARNVDVGSLINATGAGQGFSQTQQTGGSNAGGYEMFRVAQMHVLRIYVNVPQANAPGIQVGMPADITVTEFTGRKFTGKVTRTANSLDPTARTMLTEVQIANKDGKLYPGMYAQIRFSNHRNVPPLLVPGDALIAGANGLQVAVLRDNEGGEEGTKKLHMQSVQVARDYGAETEVTQGLLATDVVVVNPGDEVREGAIVRPEASPDSKGQTAAKKPGSQSENQPGGISGQSPVKPSTSDQAGGTTNNSGASKK